MSILDIDFEKQEGAIPAVVKIIDLDGIERNGDGIAALREEDPLRFEDLTASDEVRFGRRPNSIYVHYVTLTRNGKFAAKHYWCHKKPAGDENWKHDDDRSTPRKKGGIRPNEVRSIVEKVLLGNYTEGHVEEITPDPTILDVTWRWISWAVVIFDHQAWRFIKNGLVFQSYESENSFFPQKRINLDLNKHYQPTAIVMSNYMRKNDLGDELGAGDKPEYKFDLHLLVRLEGGGKVLVKVDPTGTNDGPTGGGEEP